ncbi:hypothetical protein IIY66_01955 [Candidatus Saccharibacteria bacterium]|nr:hypothetical protein [Candidatus Saccharibacteria bacterium]
MGEIVRFDSQQLALMQQIIDKNNERWQELAEAYDWALDRQRELQFMAQPVHMTFSRGDYVDDGDGFTISIFYKKSTGEALLRRDWTDRMAVSYNILTNFGEIARIAPKSLELMLRNGLRLKEEWEDKH